MPRTARNIAAGICYHVLNRGNGRATIFRDEADYAAFVRFAAKASARFPVEVYSYCLMPNHFHLVLCPRVDNGLADWMHWTMTSFAHHIHRHHETSGRLWQGRFKAFPVQHDDHLHTVMRYVERNALQAGLVSRAEHWQWGSLAGRATGTCAKWLSPCPVNLGKDWVKRVNEPVTAREYRRFLRSLAKGAPFGTSGWTAEVAARLGLGSTLRCAGRPKSRKREV
jgi:putative transposase